MFSFPPGQCRQHPCKSRTLTHIASMNTRGKVVKPNGDYSCLHFLIIPHCCWVRVEAPLFTGPHEHYLDGRFRALPASVKQGWKISRLLGSCNITQWSNHIATNSFCQVRDGKLASCSAPQTREGQGKSEHNTCFSEKWGCAG